MGVNSLIMWAVIDPIMWAVITETQSFSTVGTQTSSLTFWMLTLDLARCGLRTLPNAGLMLCILKLQWCRDTGFEPCQTQASCSTFWGCSDVETWASNLASWCYSDAMTQTKSRILIITVQLGHRLRPSRLGTWLNFLPAHKINNFRFKNKLCKCSIRIRGSSGYAGHDPQGGTSDGSVCKLSLKIFIILMLS